MCEPSFISVNPFSPAVWLVILERVLGKTLSNKLDVIDITWDGLSATLTKLDSRELLILKLRYQHQLTLKEAGKYIPRKDKKKGPISGNIARGIETRAFQKLRHPSQLKTIKTCIAGVWMLDV